MTKQIQEFLIKKGDLMNAFYKAFQTIATTVILAGVYGVYAKAKEYKDLPERVTRIEQREIIRDSVTAEFRREVRKDMGDILKHLKDKEQEKIIQQKADSLFKAYLKKMK